VFLRIHRRIALPIEIVVGRPSFSLATIKAQREIPFEKCNELSEEAAATDGTNRADKDER